jgi:hypothetical protein
MLRNNKPLHIGIIACSAEGASLCYRTIFRGGGAIAGAAWASGSFDAYAFACGLCSLP